MFGAVGDGITNDAEAIRRAHLFANINKEKVSLVNNKTYRITTLSEPIPIETDVDWGNSTFIIDDTVGQKDIIFYVRHIPDEDEEIKIITLKKDEKTFPVKNSVITLYNQHKKRFIRFGDNGGIGSPQCTTFYTDNDGNIKNYIPFDFDIISNYECKKIEQEPIHICGGHFITIANNEEQRYNYYYRGIKVLRSNTVLENITHEIQREGLQGAPYAGFIIVAGVYNVTLKDIKIQSHRTYYNGARPGESTGTPMGTYEIQINNSINVSLINVTQENIDDEFCWGPMCTNQCHNMNIIRCRLGRFDAHCGITNCYIYDTEIGWQGIKGVGWGEMIIKNCHIRSKSLFTLRFDYGSFWDGNVTIDNCIWETEGNNCYVINAYNYGLHDFGYPCMLPNVYINGLTTTADICIYNDYNDCNYENQLYEVKTPTEVVLKDIKAKSIKITENDAHFKDLNIIYK